MTGSFRAADQILPASKKHITHKRNPTRRIAHRDA
jgi:hypothetical protein